MSKTSMAHEQAAFEKGLDFVVDRYSEVFNQPSELMHAYTKIQCLDGDKEYAPYPTLSYSDANPRDITIFCNVAAYKELWEPVFCSVDGISTEKAKKLYVGTAIAWVGLVNNALTAKVDREEGRRTKKLQSVIRIQRAMQDADSIYKTIEELERTEKIESSLYPIEVSDEEVQRINRLRYGLGTSYIINNVPPESRDQLMIGFTQELSVYFKKLGSELIDFALKFGLDKTIEPDLYKQKGISRAFHSFYFAGIQPMDILDIIG